MRLCTSNFRTPSAARRNRTKYEYDPATGRLTHTYTDDTDTSYDYNELGQLWHVTTTKLNGDTVDLVTTYTYDAVGDLDTVIQPNGVVEDYDYDNLNRLDKVTVTNSGNHELFEQDYTLLANGQRDYVIEKRFDGSSSTPFSTTKIDWSYDAENRLTSETRDEGNDATQNGGDYTDTFAFDLAGNRITKGHDAVGTTNDETITYAYNERDELTAEDSTNNANDATYSYDANGSTTEVTKGGTTQKYVWDLRNRMVGFDANGDGDTADTGDATYGYDTDGNRVSKTVVGTGTTYYVIDSNNLTGYAKALEEKSTPSASPTRSYVFGHDIIAQRDATNGTLFFLKDGHGTTRALTDGDGVVTEAYDFDAFLNPIGFDPATALAEWLAPDGRTDAETGLRLNGARYVTDARFLSSDAGWQFAGDPSSPSTLHIYSYTPSNPLVFIDPTGAMSESEAKAWIDDNLETIKADGNGDARALLGALSAIYVELRRQGKKDWLQDKVGMSQLYIPLGGDIAGSFGPGQIKTSFAEWTIEHDRYGTFARELGAEDNITLARQKIVNLIYDHPVRIAVSAMRTAIDDWDAAHSADPNIPDISTMPGILATLYNIGPKNWKSPHPNPQLGGTILTIDGKTANFGQHAKDFAESPFALSVMQRMGYTVGQQWSNRPAPQAPVKLPRKQSGSWLRDFLGDYLSRELFPLGF